MDTNRKYKKAGMEEGLMHMKCLQAWWRRDIFNTISYVELLMNTLKIKNNFCNGHQYEMQNKPGWRME